MDNNQSNLNNGLNKLIVEPLNIRAKVIKLNEICPESGLDDKKTPACDNLPKNMLVSDSEHSGCLTNAAFLLVSLVPI